MRGKVCVVTGGNAGIGYETARGLAARGAEVVLLCRSAERGEEAAARIAAEHGARPAVVRCDLGDRDSVREASEALLSRWDRLDVLVHNAGATFQHRYETSEGIELTFATNHLGPSRLTARLEDRLRATPGARVVVVSSEAHRFGRLDLADLPYVRGRYVGMKVYGDSKLCNLLFARELARRLDGSGVVVNALHPGTVASGFALNDGGLYSVLVWLAGPFLPGPEQGARTPLHVACSDEAGAVTGAYFARSRQAVPSRAAVDDGLAARLWEVTSAFGP